MAGFARLGFCTECRTPDVMTMPSRWTGDDVCRDCDDADPDMATPAPGVKRRFSLEPGICSVCDGDRDNGGPKPPHDASDRCQSGMRSHCTCGACFG